MKERKRIYVARQSTLLLLLQLLITLHKFEKALAWASHRHFHRQPTLNRSRLHSRPSESTDVSFDFKIRDSLYGDLGPVSNLMVTSFYPPEKANDNMWKHLYRLAELNRLQKAFPYPPDQDKHRMLVAVSAETNDIIGFCDIDSRKPLQPQYQNNPTPYLSDVLVDPEWRRKGIASSLIEKCEQICVEQFKSEEIFIRVIEENEAAIAMYQRLGYHFIPSPGDPAEFKLLKKSLV